MTSLLRRLQLIGAPTDIGASARGACMGPEALRVAGLQQALEGRGLQVRDLGNLSGPANPWLQPVQGYRHLPEGAMQEVQGLLDEIAREATGQ